MGRSEKGRYGIIADDNGRIHMATLSRTEKYKNLREKIQDENGSDLSAPDLSAYESRLNKIDSNNFAAPGAASPAPRSGKAAHARREPAASTIRRNQERTKSRREVMDGTRISNNENYSDDAFDNDYLNRYIQEVKQYNIEQGNAVSENTTVNVLAQLDADRSEVRRAKQNQKNEQAVKVENDDFDDTGDGITFGDSGLDILGSSSKKKDVSEDYTAPQETKASKKPVSRMSRRKNRLAEAIDSLADTEALADQYEQKPTVNTVKESEKPVEPKRKDFTDNLDFDDDFLDEKPSEETKKDDSPAPLSKEDIMAQVQSMVNGTASEEPEEAQPEDPDHVDTPVGQDTYNRHLAEDKAKHQAVLNETNSMRAQLDDYEDDLSEVSDKVRHTNQILNIVLIVLIIALSIVLCVVIYWIIRGM
jgi:hypothetical protein